MLSSSSSTSMSSSSNSSSSCDVSLEDSLSPLQYLPLLRRRPTRSFNLMKVAVDMVRSLFPSIHGFVFPTCQWSMLPVVPARASSLSAISPGGRRRVVQVAGTFFGHRKGRVSFAVQVDSRSEPVLLLELAMTTCDLVKEMASGMVRILLECDRIAPPAVAAKKTNTGNKKHAAPPLLDEPLWTMYCNGHRHGYALSRRCTGFDLHVLSMVKAVSVGAGVLPPLPPLLPAHPLEMGKGSCKIKDGMYDSCCVGEGVGAAAGAGCDQVMYMRAKFERVVGSKDSEAFYLINPDSVRHKRSDVSGGPELCIFLLRM